MRRWTSAPKPAARALHVGLGEVPALDPQPEPHAVIAGEVGRSLGRGDDVVGRQRVSGVWQRDLHQLRTLGSQPVRTALPDRRHLGRHAGDRIFLRDADAQAAHVAGKPAGPVRHRKVGRGAVHRVVAGHGLQQQRAVLDRARHRPRLVQRAREGDDAPARAAAIGRLDPGDAAERGRLADRAASVGAGGAQAQPGRHGRGRAARAAARHEVAIVARPGPGIAHPAVVGGQVRRTHRELVEIGLPQTDRARFPQFAADRRFIGRHESVQDVRAGGGEHALGAEQILDAERDAFEQAAFAAAEPRVGGLGHRQRLVRRLGDEGVEAPMALDGRDMRPGQLQGREAARREAVARRLQGQPGELAHSTTFGTTK